MHIDCGATLEFALTAQREAKELASLLQQAELLAGSLEYYGLDNFPNFEDAVSHTNAALNEIDKALDVYQGKAA
jgi:hypothetical protein